MENYFSQLLNVGLFGVNDARLTEMPLVPGRSSLEPEIATENLKRWGLLVQIASY
jgi:hypothetical protein